MAQQIRDILAVSLMTSEVLSPRRRVSLNGAAQNLKQCKNYCSNRYSHVTFRSFLRGRLPDVYVVYLSRYTVSCRWEDNIKMDLQEVGGVVGTGWSWLRIGTVGGHLWVR
jgi:hypothetical protein